MKQCKWRFPIDTAVFQNWILFFSLSNSNWHAGYLYSPNWFLFFCENCGRNREYAIYQNCIIRFFGILDFVQKLWRLDLQQERLFFISCIFTRNGKETKWSLMRKLRRSSSHFTDSLRMLRIKEQEGNRRASLSPERVICNWQLLIRDWVIDNQIIDQSLSDW